ncbi:hypothetical protein SRHO_G00290040 [Serrasalmus rhombeus]
MVVIQARAKAQAAKARANFMNKEIELKTETAHLQATLEAMQEEKEMKAAFAEAEILEASLLEADCKTWKSQHSFLFTNSFSTQPTMCVTKSVSSPFTSQPDQMRKAWLSTLFHSAVKRHPNLMLLIIVGNTGLHVDSPSAASCSSTTLVCPLVPANQGAQATTLDLIKCMARSQLVTTGLTAFDDKPENYWAWKSSFQSTSSSRLSMHAG